MHMISKSFLPLSLSVSLSVCQTSNKSQSLPLTSDAKQNSFGNAARIPVWLLPMARERTLGVSGSSPAWHISLSNAMASAEGVDIIPKLKHSVFVPTAQQTRDGNDSVMDGWGDGGGRLIVSEEVQKVFEFMLKKREKSLSTWFIFVHFPRGYKENIYMMRHMDKIDIHTLSYCTSTTAIKIS